jgi:methylenetetrahydrofolate dehydrogenase (NADP+)/methenyltetrahydrofolate cyclohydrolase
MEIIDGKKIAQDILDKLQLRIQALSTKPILCDVLVGNDPVSLSYVNIKKRKAEQVGIEFKLAQFNEQISNEELIFEIQKLNSLPNICGLIVQLPLPSHLDRQKVLNSILERIDVDVLTSVNSQKFYKNDKILIPPTASAVIYLLEISQINLRDKNILVVGHGELVGKPVAYLLKQRGLSVTVADEQTQNLGLLSKEADVIISGTGVPKLITSNMIKPGVIIIDAGTAESGSSIVGDVDFEGVSGLASFISPVPGGVGPVTVAKLLENVVTVAESDPGLLT